MNKKKVLRVSTIPLSLNVLLKGQLKMLNEHFEVVGVSSPGEDLSIVSEREGIRTIALPMERRISPFKDLVSLWRMIRLIRKERPYIIHSITPKAGLISMLAAWMCRVPVRIHMFTGLVFPTAKGFTKKILMTTDRITCACATKILPEGEGVKRDLLNNGITKKPLKVLGYGNINGIDIDYFSPNAIEPQQKSDKFTFIFIGRIVADKGMNELVTALKRLRQHKLDFKLILVGNFENEHDPLRSEDKEFLMTCPNVEYVGYQNDVRPFLKRADALVFPSYREGFPNVVIQAGAMGLPSIVTDINGCNEIIIEGKNGTIIPPRDANALHDAMLKFITDKEHTTEMSANARKMVVSRYNQPIVWDALLKEYLSLCQ